MKRTWAALALMLAPILAFGQGGAFHDVTLKSTAAQGGATVRVCTEAATGTPCSPLASIYSDKALTVSVSNPTTSTSIGNFSFYAVPNRYKVQISGSGITTYEYIITVPGEHSARYADQFSTIAAACTDLGGAAGTVIVTSAVTVAADTTIPANCALSVRKGGSFAISSAKTLTIGGPFDAGPYSIFTGAGTVIFATSNPGLVTAYPEWWGAKREDSAVNSTTAINAAISSNAKEIHFLKGEYFLGSAILLSKTDLRLVGDRTGTLLTPQTTSFAGTNYIMDVTYVGAGLNSIIKGIRFRGFTPAGNWTGGGIRAGSGGAVGAVTLTVRDCYFDLSQSSGDVFNGSAHDFNWDNNGIDINGGPIRITFGSSIRIINSTFAQQQHDGIVLDGGTPKSISTISRTTNVTTVGITGHGYAVDELVVIRGVADTTFNGRFRIATVTANDFTYSNPGSNGSSSGGTATVPDVNDVIIDGIQVQQLSGSTAQGNDSLIKVIGADSVKVSNVRFSGQQTALVSSALPNLIRIESSTGVTLHNLDAWDNRIGSGQHIDSLAYIDSSQVRASMLRAYQANYLLQITGKDNDIEVSDSISERSQQHDILLTGASPTGRLKVSTSTFLRGVGQVLASTATGTRLLDVEFSNNRIEDPRFNGTGTALVPAQTAADLGSRFDLFGNRFIRSSANSWTGFFVDLGGITAEQKIGGNIFPTTGNNITGANANTRRGFNVGLDGTEDWGTIDTANIGGPLLWSTDNNTDMGAAGATRPRTLYLGTSLDVAGSKAIIGSSGTITKYNNIATVSNGVPSELATVDLTAQTAAVGTTTLYAVPATGAGQYRVSWNAKVTTAATTGLATSTLGALTIVYTDPDSVVQTITMPASVAAGTIATTSTGNSTMTVLLGLPLMLNCKASTNITYAMAYASDTANQMAYNLHIKLEAQ